MADEPTGELDSGSAREVKDARRLSVIDEAGRIRLPTDWRRLFPDGRAEIREEADHLRIKPP